MELTRTPQSALAAICPVDNSPAAERVLSAMRQRFGIVAEAVYFAVHRCEDTPKRGRIARMRSADCTPYVDEAVLTLYIHAGHSPTFVRSDALDAEIFDCFLAALAEAGEAIPTGGTKAVRRRVELAYIDHLTLWHRLTASLRMLNRLPAVQESGAKLYCSFDADGAPRPLALFAERPTGAAAEAVADRLTEAIYARMKPRDIRDAVTRASVRPMFGDYASLTAEQRFALARENGENYP